MERVPEDDLESAKPLHEAVRREALEELTAGKCAVRLRKSWLGWMRWKAGGRTRRICHKLFEANLSVRL